MYAGTLEPIDDLFQDCGISIANTGELPQFYAKSSLWFFAADNAPSRYISSY